MSQLIVEVCKVEEIFKHPGADKLSVVKIKDWNCIVGLNEYKEGDLVVYIPPDSIVPDNLIEKYNLTYLKKNGRVGTVKLRQYISQGLVLPIMVLGRDNYKEGKNVAQELNITKYEPPTPSYQNLGGGARTRKKRNPLFDKYVEIENARNFPNVFKEGDIVVINSKIHGTNARYTNIKRYTKTFFGSLLAKIFGMYEFCYGSHNIQLGSLRGRKYRYYDKNVYAKIAKRYKLNKIIPKDTIIYCEIYGFGIQELTYGLNDINMVVIDAKHNGKYIDYDKLVDLCSRLGLPMAPELYKGRYTPEKLKECTEGESLLCPGQIREGCVIKSLKEEYHPKIGRKILKSINCEYLATKDRSEFH